MKTSVTIRDGLHQPHCSLRRLFQIVILEKVKSSFRREGDSDVDQFKIFRFGNELSAKMFIHEAR